MADCLGSGRLSHDASLASHRLHHRQSCGVYGGRCSGVAPGGTSVPRVEGRVGAARHGRLRRPFMNIQAHRAEYQDVEAMRGLYSQELNCQIIRDSFLSRGLADPYLILVEGRIGGYGAVSNKYDKGRLVEFYALPHTRSLALPMFRELLTASQATHIEAQTNNPLMLLMLYDCARNITAENILFHDAFAAHLACPNGVFRRAVPEDAGAIFSHQQEPIGDCVIEVQ